MAAFDSLHTLLCGVSSFITTLNDNRNPEESISKGSLLAANLKAANRTACLSVESSRQLVAQASSRADARNLSLQNLLYEKAYLEREIQKCADYPTPHLDALSLLPLSSLPEHILTEAGNDEHALMLSRLRHEMEVRQSMQGAGEEARQRLAALRSSNSSRVSFLEGLPATLASLETAAAPLYPSISLAPSKRHARYARTINLPGPLYTLFSRLEAACEVADGTEGIPGTSLCPPFPLRPMAVEVVDAVLGSISVVGNSDSALGVGAVGSTTGSGGPYRIPASRHRLFASSMGGVALATPHPHSSVLENSNKRARSSNYVSGAGPETPSVGGKLSTTTVTMEEEGGVGMVPQVSSGSGVGSMVEEGSAGRLFEEGGLSGMETEENSCVWVSQYDLLRPHPKALLFALWLPEGWEQREEDRGSHCTHPGVCAALRFQYLPLLDLVTVGVDTSVNGSTLLSLLSGSGGGSSTASPPPPPPPRASLPYHSLFCLLSPGDTGSMPARWLEVNLNSTHPSDGEAAAAAAMPLLPFGRGFWWAQTLAGIDTPPPSPTLVQQGHSSSPHSSSSSSSSSSALPPSTASILRSLRLRLGCAACVQQQVGALVVGIRQSSSVGGGGTVSAPTTIPTPHQFTPLSSLSPWLSPRFQRLVFLTGAAGEGGGAASIAGLRSDALHRLGGETLLGLSTVLANAMLCARFLLGGGGGGEVGVGGLGGEPVITTAGIFSAEDCRPGVLHSTCATYFQGTPSVTPGGVPFRYIRVILSLPPPYLPVQLLLQLAPSFPEPGSFRVSLLPLPHSALASSISSKNTNSATTGKQNSTPIPPTPALLPHKDALASSLVALTHQLQQQSSRNPAEAAKSTVSAFGCLSSVLRASSATLFCPPQPYPLLQNTQLLGCILWVARCTVPAVASGRLALLLPNGIVEEGEFPPSLFIK